MLKGCVIRISNHATLNQVLWPRAKRVMFAIAHLEILILGVLDDEVEGLPRRLRAHAQQVDDVRVGADALHYLHLLDEVGHVLRGRRLSMLLRSLDTFG